MASHRSLNMHVVIETEGPDPSELEEGDLVGNLPQSQKYNLIEEVKVAPLAQNRSGPINREGVFHEGRRALETCEIGEDPIDDRRIVIESKPFAVTSSPGII